MYKAHIALNKFIFILSLCDLYLLSQMHKGVSEQFATPVGMLYDDQHTGIILFRQRRLKQPD